MWLQECLGVPTPTYAHLPVAVNAAGEKLSKQTRAPAVDPRQGSRVLAEVMRFLGFDVPAGLRQAPLPEFWVWAQAAWSVAGVPKVRAIHLPGTDSD